jgi:hypothetical protein
MDEREAESVELFGEVSGLYEYEVALGVSREVAQRHLAIRQIIHAAGGVVPSTKDLQMTLLMKGFRCTQRTVRNDLQAMGWR